MENTELKSELTLVIKDNTYKVKFPDTGKLIDLEQAKSLIQAPNNSSASLWAYNLALAITTFRFLIPKLQEDLNVKSFDRLELMESQELVKVYIKTFRPWFDSWINKVSDIFDEDEK